MYENDQNNNYGFNYDQNNIGTTGAPTPQPNPEPPKKRNSGNKFMAIAIVTVLGCSSLGIGLGVGGGIYNSMSKTGTTQSVAITESEIAAPPSLTFKPEESTAPKAPSIVMDNLASGVSDSDVVSVIGTVSNSVVSINVTGVYRDIFNRALEATSAGSGIIYAEDNASIYIVTNYHVIENAESVEISIDDDKSVVAAPVGSNPESDIAVIKVAKADLIKEGIDEYAIAVFGDAESMQVGETVIAIGNALGEGKSATLGIISAKNKQISAESNNYVDVIQTDAAINKGNSGGALVNLKGQVIGVNTAKLSATGVEGMSYAIPSNAVKEIVDVIMEESSGEKPYIGISGITITEKIKEMYSLPSFGVYVAEISVNSGARDAGMQAGDIITKFNGVPILAMDTLQNEIATLNVGDSIEVVINRNGEEITMNVELKDSNAYKSF